MADQAMAAPSAPAATAQASRPIDVPAPPAAAAAAAHVAASPDATGLSPPCGSGRCFACNKKTGLTGFICKCGQSFCGSHRYADAHACSFDYKAAAAQQLAKANPVVAASKIDKARTRAADVVLRSGALRSRLGTTALRRLARALVLPPTRAMSSPVSRGGRSDGATRRGAGQGAYALRGALCSSRPRLRCIDPRLPLACPSPILQF
jgi:hypothetical protein